MKRLFSIVLAVCTLAAASCIKYDDSEIRNDINDLKGRVSTLEELMSTANGNISSLWELVHALERKYTVDSVEKTEDGWTIRFTNGETATLKNGTTPVIGVAEYEGTYYWTVDGKWLTDKDGNKIPVTGKDGEDGDDAVAPKLKIEGDSWYMSTDGGETWTYMGQATGDSFLKDVTESYDYVYITLADGTVLTLPKSDVKELFQRIQSIQYVPDYEDGKITVNTAYVYYPDPLSGSGKRMLCSDQPTEITYQILPAQYASKVAKSIRFWNIDLDDEEAWNEFREYLPELPEKREDLTGPELRRILKEVGMLNSIAAWFDVRPVKTRSGGGEETIEYGMKIVDILSANDNTGEITFKVLPYNIASAGFIAAGLQPRYDIELYDTSGYSIYAGSLDYFYYDQGPVDGNGWMGSSDYDSGILSWAVPVWMYDDIMAYQNRSAFAAQLRLYSLQDCELVLGNDGNLEWLDYENELASPFTTLYPESFHITVNPGAFVTGPDGNLTEITAAERQYLPYDVLRKDATSSEPGYRTILDNLTLAVTLESGETMSVEEAWAKGYFIPGYNIEKKIVYNGKSKEATLAKENEDGYIEVEMNPSASESVRKAAIGSNVEGRYTIKTPFNSIDCTGFVEITDGTDPGTGPGPGPGPGPDARFDFLHLSNYTFNSVMEDGNFIYKLDFAANDGSVVWWTQCAPAYYTTPSPAATGTGPGPDAGRVSSRHALAEYSPVDINLFELAFNVVDANDNILSPDDMAKNLLSVEFEYTDPAQGNKWLPDINQYGGFFYYKDLWVDKITFHYQTNEKPFIPVKAKLLQFNGSENEELPSRFGSPRASVEHPEDMLDYSTFAVVPWVPFKDLVAEDQSIRLDQHKIYRVPLTRSISLMDNRPSGVSYYVIKDGEWIIGDVADVEHPEGGNGYVYGISSKDAYSLHRDIDFSMDSSRLPADLKRMTKIVYSYDGDSFSDTFMYGATPYLAFDYSAESQFNGSVDIPVHVELVNPWQATLTADFVVTVYGDDPTGGSSSTGWAGKWKVRRGDFYDTWTITPTADPLTYLITGISGYTDTALYYATATENADGNLILMSQYAGSYEDPEKGNIDILISGNFYNDAGQDHYMQRTDEFLLTGRLSEDGNSANLEPGSSTTGYPFYAIKFFHLYKKYDGSVGSLSSDGRKTPLPQTITRITE